MVRYFAALAPDGMERRALTIIEQLFVGSLVGRTGGLNERICGQLSTSRQCRQRRSEQTRPANSHHVSSAQEIFAGHPILFALMAQFRAFFPRRARNPGSSTR